MGHVGDSKAVMCRVGKVVRLTQDHNPENNMEKQRIKAAGGHITWTSTGSPRVNGKLNMTRSIGDLDLKGVGVTAEPETRSIEVMVKFLTRWGRVKMATISQMHFYPTARAGVLVLGTRSRSTWVLNFW